MRVLLDRLERTDGFRWGQDERGGVAVEQQQSDEVDLPTQSLEHEQETRLHGLCRLEEGRRTEMRLSVG